MSAPRRRPKRPDRVIVMAEAGGRLGDVELDYSYADAGTDSWPWAMVSAGMGDILEDIRHGKFWEEAARLTKTTGSNGKGWTKDTRPAILAVLRAEAMR